LEAPYSRGKWEGPNYTAAPFIDCIAGGDAGISYKNTDENGLWLSNKLQSGFSFIRETLSNRDRRGNAQKPKGERKRPEENRLIREIRVESIEVLQQTSDGTFGGLCPDGYVYNLEVEDNYNYFANGILVHNCHRATSKGWVDIFKAAAAPFRLGLSGTPIKNEDDRDLLLQSVTGPIVFHLETSKLQGEGHIAEADLITVAITSPEIKHLDWQTAFKALIVENQDRTDIIADMAVKYAAEGKTVLILAGNSVKFANNIYDAIESIIIHNQPSCKVEADIVTGTTKADLVNKAFQALRDKTLDILVTTLLADEGVDVPAINVLMTVGGGKSYVKFIQRVGRGLRVKEDGSSLLVIDFFDMTNKYLIKHAKERLKYYTEENIFKSGTTIIDNAYQMEYQR
jgi:superfamily II DNA or RNA helicase